MTDLIKCFLLLPTGRTRLYLRRYTPWERDQARKCPGKGYHNADVLIDTVDGEAAGRSPDPTELADPRWPATCDSCAYVFDPADTWHRQTWSEYRRADTGELGAIHEFPAGAMWWADWLTGHHASKVHVEQRGNGPHLIVRTPGGDWDVDAPSSNQNGAGWQRTGEAPLVLAWPSIWMGQGTPRDYHGFLGGSDKSKPGYLVRC